MLLQVSLGLRDVRNVGANALKKSGDGLGHFFGVLKPATSHVSTPESWHDVDLHVLSCQDQPQLPKFTLNGWAITSCRNGELH